VRGVGWTGVCSPPHTMRKHMPCTTQADAWWCVRMCMSAWLCLRWLCLRVVSLVVFGGRFRAGVPTDTALLCISKARRREPPIGKRLICQTFGWFTMSGDKQKRAYIDLWYILVFPWNGTLGWHAFDVEYVIVRVAKSLQAPPWLDRVFGSCHGNGRWFRAWEMERDGDHVSLFPGRGSHAMYTAPGVKKRMFGFGNDVCGRGKPWTPTELLFLPAREHDLGAGITLHHGFVITPRDNGPPDIRKGAQPGAGGELDPYYFTGRAGNDANSQLWPVHYNSPSQEYLDPGYKYGDLDNLFYGRYRKLPAWVLTLLEVLGGVFLGGRRGPCADGLQRWCWRSCAQSGLPGVVHDCDDAVRSCEV